MTTNPSTAIVAYDSERVDPEHIALAGFLGGYRGITRDAYALDLRQFVAFCEERHLGLFEVRRRDIEAYGRGLEARGRATATVGRRLCTVTGFYRYAEEEGLIAHSPAVHVRRPRIDYESHAIGLDRNEVRALLVPAGLGPATEHALVSLLALNGLRVSEAIGADIEALGLERGHRTLTILRKGGKTVPSQWHLVPREPSTSPSANATAAPYSSTQRARGSTATGPAGSFGVSPGEHGSPSRLDPIRSGTHSSRLPLGAGVLLREVQEAASHADPRTTMRYDRARVSLDRHAIYIVSTYIAGAAR